MTDGRGGGGGRVLGGCGPLWGIAFALVYGFYSSFFMGRLYYLRIMILFELGFIKVM